MSNHHQLSSDFFFQQTNEVNQGDSLEHNFACCVHVLTFPVAHGMSDMSQVGLEIMKLVWSKPTLESLLWLQVHATKG